MDRKKDIVKLSNKIIEDCMESDLSLEDCMAVLMRLYIEYATHDQMDTGTILQNLESLYRYVKFARTEPTGAMH